MYQTFGGNVHLEYFGKHIQFHGRDLIVCNDLSKKYVEEMRVYADHHVRVLPAGVQFPTDTIIFGDTVALFAYDEEKTIVRIQNQNLAESFLAWFEALWGMSKAS